MQFAPTHSQTLDFETGVITEPSTEADHASADLLFLHPLEANPRTNRIRLAVKRAIDIAGSSSLILCLLPVLLFIIVAARTDGGPALYGHERIGRGGKRFKCLKFRTMVMNADQMLAALLRSDPLAAAEWEATRKLRHDPRVTALGQILRATSLDELPQLFNVLEGSMSLVGPRPVTNTELKDFYKDSASAYMSVRPGLTGPWQINGRSETTYVERVAYDVAYTQNLSIRTDVKILLLTVPAVMTRRGSY